MLIGLSRRRRAVIVEKDDKYAITVQHWTDGMWHDCIGGQLAPQDDQLAALDRALEWSRTH